MRDAREQLADDRVRGAQAQAERALEPYSFEIF